MKPAALISAGLVTLLSQTTLEAEEATTSPHGGTPAAIPGLIEAEHYDEGPADLAYHDTDPENQGAPYRKDTQVDIERRPDASNKHGLGWTRTGEWVLYTVDVKEAGTYTIEFPVASQKQGGVFRIEANGKDVTGAIEIPDTGGWHKLQTIKKEGVRLEAGVQQLKLVLEKEGPSGSIGDIDYMKFTKTADPAAE